MPRITGTTGSAPAAKPVKVRARAKAAPPKPVKVRSTAPPQTPDSRDNNRLARHPPVSHVSPDAQDVAGRSGEQRLHDAAYAQDVQDAARGKNPTLAKELGLHPSRAKAKARTGHGPSLNPLAVIHLPSAYVKALAHPHFGGMGVVSGAAGVAGRSAKDAEEMAVTLPSSVAHLASTAVHHPEKVPGELLAPYKQLAEHPIKSLSQHPLQTALMVAPAVRMPGRVLGKGLRVAGKQTLTRPAASLPGTAFKVTRTGSRDAVVRALQSHLDRKHGAPAVTVKDVQQRVDEHFDAERHLAQHAETRAVRASRKATKGQPRQVRRDAATQAREQARAHAHEDADQRFAQEFGANVRLSTGAAERELAGRMRAHAVQRVTEARGVVRAANAEHERALGAARVAKAKAKASPRLRALETQRTNAARALVTEQKAATAAQVEHVRATGAARVSVAREKSSPALKALQGQRRTAQQELSRAQKIRNAAAAAHSGAKGRAEILSRNVGGGGSAGGYGIKLATDALGRADEGVRVAQGAIKDIDRRIAAERKRIAGVAPAEQDRLARAIEGRDVAPVRVRVARQNVRDLDQQIATERQRISGVPPTEHQALLDAIHGRGQARTELAGARAAADAARTVHIQAKQGMAHAALVSPSGAGRLFTHRADAAAVARKLNEQAHQLKQGTRAPVRFQLHEPSANGAVVSAVRGGSATAPLEFGVRQVGEKWVAVPKVAAHRMYPSGGPDSPLSHASVGASKSTMAKVMRTSRGAFTSAVLPFSAKWLAGQGGEAGLRAAVAGAGPFDLMRFNRVVKKLNDRRPGAGDELKARITGGHFDLTGPARDFATGKKTLAEEFAGTSLRQPAAAATYAGHVLPARALRRGFAAYSRAVMGGINGALEQTARRAMAGQAIKNLGLIDNHLIGLTDKAIADAADKLQHTENQVAATRAVNRMYGKYQGSARRCGRCCCTGRPSSRGIERGDLPDEGAAGRPSRADCAAGRHQRRRGGLAQEPQPVAASGSNHVPDFLLGSVPKGGSLRIAHYTPFGVGSDVTGAVGSLALPQVTGPMLNMLGIDWKGDPLTHGGSHGKPFNPRARRLIRALTTAAEEQVPGVSQAGTVSGVTPRLVDKKDPSTVRKPGQVLRGYLPTTPTGSGSASSAQQPLSGGAASSTGRVKPVRVKPVAAGSGRVKPVRVKPVKVR
jgi:hypothetical protein